MTDSEAVCHKRRRCSNAPLLAHSSTGAAASGVTHQPPVIDASRIHGSGLGVFSNTRSSRGQCLYRDACIAGVTELELIMQGIQHVMERGREACAVLDLYQGPSDRRTGDITSARAALRAWYSDSTALARNSTNSSMLGVEASAGPGSVDADTADDAHHNGSCLTAIVPSLKPVYSLLDDIVRANSFQTEVAVPAAAASAAAPAVDDSVVIRVTPHTRAADASAVTRLHAHVLLPLLSRVNHSCEPNCAIHIVPAAAEEPDSSAHELSPAARVAERGSSSRPQLTVPLVAHLITLEDIDSGLLGDVL